MGSFFRRLKNIRGESLRSASSHRRTSSDPNQPNVTPEPSSAPEDLALSQASEEDVTEECKNTENSGGLQLAKAPNQSHDPIDTDDTMIDVASETPTRIRERLWNQAYDGLKAKEPDTVDAYEKLLSNTLRIDDPDIAPGANVISPAREQRRPQMERLVQVGLRKTAKEAVVKEKIGDKMQTIRSMKGAMDVAVQAAPQAAVAWVGICFGLEILSNTLTEPGVNREGLTYVISRMDWYWNLADLLLDEGASPSFSGLRHQLEDHIIQLYQKLLLYQMKSICLYHRHRVTVLSRDVVKLDDWRGQLDDIKAAEADVQRNSEQYNSQQAKCHLQDIAVAVDRQLVEVQGVAHAFELQTARQEKVYHDQKDEQCLHDLYETDPRHDKTRIEETKGGLIRDSFTWILDNPEFKQWRTDSRSRLLWIKGDPGKGKTMLMCGIIDELDKNPTQKPSYFFCQATEQRLNNATAVLRGLIYNFVRQCPSLLSHVRKEYDGGGGKQRFEDKNAWQVMSKILTAMLYDPILDSTVMIIDALDECSAGRSQLLDFVIRASAMFPAKWIVSSRNWPDIEEKLRAAAQKVTLRLELNEDSIADAVRAYIRYKVDELAQLKDYDETTRVIVHQQLTDKSSNTFLWVALVCQELAAPTVRRWHTLNILQRVPSGLDSLYQRMMEQICGLIDADLCTQILAVVCVVYRPVTLQELTSMIDSLKSFDDDLESLKDVIKSCGSFLNLQVNFVYFVHQSAKDFLLDKASDRILPSGVAHQHLAIHSMALEVLSQTLRRDIYNLRHPGFSIEDVIPPKPDPLAPAKYSCLHWVDHLQDAHSATELTLHLQDGGPIHTFLKQKLLYWLEAMSLERSMSQAALAVQKLESLLAAARAPQLADLVRDAGRFILSYKSAVEASPLQLYASALLFSPTNSRVRNLFKHHIPTWVTLRSSVQTDWDACVQTLEGHSDPVMSVAFSPDGQRLASRSKSDVKIWDAATGTCEQTLAAYSTMWYSPVTFSADSQRLLSASCWTMNNHFLDAIKVWEIAMGACVHTLESNDGMWYSMAVSANHQRVATGSIDRITVWEVATGTSQEVLVGHRGPITSLAFSANGLWLASGSLLGTVKIWDVATNTCLRTLANHRGTGREMTFSVDSQQLVSASEDGSIILWDVATGVCVQILKGHSGSVLSVAFSPDGRRLASGSDDCTIKLWDTATGVCLQTLVTYAGSVCSIAFSADGQWLASGATNHTIKIWDVAMVATMQMPVDHGGRVNSMTFSADSQLLLTGSDDNTAKVWDVATGACVRTLESHSGPVESVAFSPETRQLALGHSAGIIKIWDVATGSCVQTLRVSKKKRILAVAFSADGRKLAWAYEKSDIRIRDLAMGACVQTLGHHYSWIDRLRARVLEQDYPDTLSMAFSADDQRLASGCGRGMVKIWAVTTGECTQTFNIEGRVHHISFDSNTSVGLSSNIGFQALDFTKAAALEPQVGSYGLSSDESWVTENKQKLLWIPSEYRPSSLAVAGSTIAYGSSSGKVLIIHFQRMS